MDFLRVNFFKMWLKGGSRPAYWADFGECIDDVLERCLLYAPENAEEVSCICFIISNGDVVDSSSSLSYGSFR